MVMAIKSGPEAAQAQNEILNRRRQALRAELAKIDEEARANGRPDLVGVPRRDRYDVVQDALQAYNREYHSWRMRPTTSDPAGPVELFRVEMIEPREPKPHATIIANHGRGPECRNEAQAEGWRCFKAMEAALAEAGVELPPKTAMVISDTGPDMPQAHSPETA